MLLGVLQAGPDAYGVPVWEAIVARTGRDVSLGAVYKTLERLEAKTLVSSGFGEPTPERGGRRKRHYHVTPQGLRVLRQTVSALERMRAGLEELLET